MNRYSLIPGFSSHYEICDNGTVYSLKSGERKPLKSIVHSTGYLTINLCDRDFRKTIRIHRLVCNAFHSNPDNLPSVNHKDLNKQNNHYNNLEWISSQGNTDHAKAAGVINFSGFNNPSAKLTEEDLKVCWQALLKGSSIGDLSSRFNVNRNTIPKAVARIYGPDWKNQLYLAGVNL